MEHIQVYNWSNYLGIIERSSNFDFRKTISKSQTGIEPATSWWPIRRCDHWATGWTWAHHVSLGGYSVVRLSNWSFEGCCFDSRLGLRNGFLEIRAWRTFIKMRAQLMIFMWRGITTEIKHKVFKTTLLTFGCGRATSSEWLITNVTKTYISIYTWW